jgi:hypothetical protein
MKTLELELHLANRVYKQEKIFIFPYNLDNNNNNNTLKTNNEILKEAYMILLELLITNKLQVIEKVNYNIYKIHPEVYVYGLDEDDENFYKLDKKDFTLIK